MGLFDGIADKVMGKTGAQDNLLTAIMALIGSEKIGGIQGLIAKFKEAGLGDAVNSWVSTAKNIPVSPQQVQQVLGNDTIKDLASKAGLPQDQLTSQLSKLLPDLVDKLSPDGQIPKGDLMSKGMDVLKGMFN